MPKKYTGKDTLDAAFKLIKQSMQYVDGSATVTFTVLSSGQVKGFALRANHDALTAETCERRHEGGSAFEDDWVDGRGGIPR